VTGVGEEADGSEVLVGIETDHGPWVSALAAAGYRVFPVNPLQSARFRQRHQVSGAKSDAGDAHVLADMVRTDFHQLREAAGDAPGAAGIKVLARTHKTMIWERTRETQRLRHQLLEYYPAALEAFSDLDAPDTLELLGRAPDPRQGRKLTRAQVSAAMKRAGRRNITERATAVLTALRSDQLAQPEALALAYAATARSLIAVITALNEQVKLLEEQVREHFGGTRTLRSSCPSRDSDRSSAPGCSQSSATTRTATATARPSGTTPLPARSPAHRASGKSLWPGTCTTTGSSTRSTPRPSPR
jgi:hypothetical protein